MRKTSLEMPIPPDLAKDFRIFIRQHRAPDAGAGGVAERPFAFDAGGHLRKHRVEEHRLELLGPWRASFSAPQAKPYGQCVGELQILAAVDQRGLVDVRSSHHLDVGLDRAGGLDRLQDADQVARADAKPVEAVDELLQRDAVFTTANFLPSSLTLTPVRGVTTVRPRDSGLGWLTCGLSGNRHGEIALRHGARSRRGRRGPSR